MNILYLHQYFVTPTMSGGTRSYEFARRWVRAGHTVTMVTADSDADAPSRRESVEDGIRVIWLGVPYANGMSYRRRIRSFIQFMWRASREAWRHRCDVVFATSTPLTIAVPAAFASRRHRAPLVFEVRDLWPAVPIAIGAMRSPAFIWLARRLERFAYTEAARIIALSPHIAAGIGEVIGDIRKVLVVPNACDLALFAEPREQGLPADDKPVILYMGTLGFVNEVEYLVRIMPYVLATRPDAVLRIVGDGAGRAAVHAAMAALPEDCRVAVELLDPVPKSGVPALMLGATVTTSTVRAVPELYGNSANKFFDGLAAGRPVVINHPGWQADLLRDSGAGLVLPRMEGQAGKMLGDFLANRRRVEAASVAAANLAAARFDRDKLAADVRATLEEAAGQASRFGAVYP